MENNRAQTAMVLRIEKSSIHDGEGLRTVVFLKGCNLRCRWCATPESQNMEIEEGFDAARQSSITYGRRMSVDEVLAEVLKDEVFYFHSDGGLTVSGGEPLLQAAFVAELLRGCRRHGIGTALETCFAVPWTRIEPVLPHLDTLFVDVKHSDSAAHRQLTGLGNEEIIANIRAADALPLSFGIIVRVPLIPGLNDGEDNLRRTAELAASLTKIKGLQLLPYHRLGSGTYTKLGRDYELAGLQPPSAADVAQKYQLIKSFTPSLPLF